MYCTHSPCKNCAQLVVASGIVRYVFTTHYRDQTGLELLWENGVHAYAA